MIRRLDGGGGSGSSLDNGGRGLDSGSSRLDGGSSGLDSGGSRLDSGVGDGLDERYESRLDNKYVIAVID